MDLPIENGGSFHSYVNVYQRVHPAWASQPLAIRLASQPGPPSHAMAGFTMRCFRTGKSQGPTHFVAGHMPLQAPGAVALKSMGYRSCIATVMIYVLMGC